MVIQVGQKVTKFQQCSQSHDTVTLRSPTGLQSTMQTEFLPTRQLKVGRYNTRCRVSLLNWWAKRRIIGEG